MPGKATFAPKDYHRSTDISLPSSEWDRVGQPAVDTKHVDVSF